MPVRKQFVKQVTALGRYLPLNRMLKWNGCAIAFPFYHIVSDERCPHVINLYRYKNVAEFRKDIDQLCRIFEPVTIDDLSNRGFEKKGGKTPMHLSFDDGLREIFEVVAPVLQEKGIPATVFINTAHIDNRQLMFRYKASLLIEKFPLKRNKFLAVRTNNDLMDTAEAKEYDFENFLKTARPYMTWRQVEALSAKGFSIGSHSYSHPYFSTLTDEQQLSESLLPFEDIAVHCPQNKKIFAFPFTDHGVSKEFIRRLLDEVHIDFSFGGAGFKHDFHPRHLQRIPMEEYAADAESILGAELLYSTLRSFTGHNTISR